MKRNILIVDKNTSTVSFISHILSSKFKIFSASTTDDGLTVALAKNPVLMLINLDASGSIDVTKLVNLVGARIPTIKFILMSEFLAPRSVLLQRQNVFGYTIEPLSVHRFQVMMKDALQCD